jgi:sugar lactone lactonase YvrE
MKHLFIVLSCFTSATVSAQTITTFAGTGTGGPLGDGGPATAASILAANSGAFDKHGNYYVAEILGHRVRKIAPDGIITTVAGTGSSGYNGDNIPATTAKLFSPTAVAIDTGDNIYICDLSNLRIRRVDAVTGIITTFAGTGTLGYNGDNIPATSAQIAASQDICLDKLANLYIADQGNNRIRKVDASGTITTVAGYGGFSSTGTGDGGPATNATFNFIFGIALDDTGNIFIADYNGAKVRKVNTAGFISTVAGTGTYPYIGDNIDAASAQMNPTKLTFDKAGHLTIADKYSRRVYKIDDLNVLHLIAGNGAAGFAGDNGPATAASTDFPAGLVYDDCGNLLIAESTNYRVRKITYPQVPGISITGSTVATIGSTITVTALITNAGSNYFINWYNNGSLFNTTTIPTVSYTKTAANDLITATVYGCSDSSTSSTLTITDTTVGVSVTRAPYVFSFPNPAGNQLHVQLVNPATYRLMTMDGKSVLAGITNAGQNSIDISCLPSGQYILELTYGTGEQTITKVVKQ